MTRVQRVYTDAQVAEALARLAVNNGNIKRTAEELDIPRATLGLWRDKQAVVSMALSGTIATTHPEIVDRAVALAERYLRLQDLALDRSETLVPLSDQLRDVLAAAREGREGHLDYSQGRRGGSVSIDARNQTIYTSDALIASLLRAKSGQLEEGEDDEAG